MVSVESQKATPEIHTINPSILYWGTAVVLVSTLNPDLTTNVSPMSSAWWIGDRCVLGLATASQTTINLIRTKQCVINLPSASMAKEINALTFTTGDANIKEAKEDEGYRYFKKSNGFAYVADKFGRAGLTPIESELVKPQRVQECPVQMEGELAGEFKLMQDVGGKDFVSLEVKVVRTHVHEEIRMAGSENRVNPDKWNPLIMSFNEFYGLGERTTERSLLAKMSDKVTVEGIL